MDEIILLCQIFFKNPLKWKKLKLYCNHTTLHRAIIEKSVVNFKWIKQSFINFKFWWYTTGIINVKCVGKHFIIANASIISSKSENNLKSVKIILSFLWIHQTLFILSFDYTEKLQIKTNWSYQGVTRK